MLATVKKWGNSYAIRLTRADLAQVGVREGQKVVVHVQRAPTEPVDLSAVPTFEGGPGFEESRRGMFAAKQAWES